MLTNVNDHVKVKLTDHGRQILQDLHDHMYRNSLGAPPYVPPEEKEGWSTWQIWDLMSTFGPHIMMGRPVPFETTIDVITQRT